MEQSSRCAPSCSGGRPPVLLRALVRPTFFTGNPPHNLAALCQLRYTTAELSATFHRALLVTFADHEVFGWRHQNSSVLGAEYNALLSQLHPLGWRVEWHHGWEQPRRRVAWSALTAQVGFVTKGTTPHPVHACNGIVLVIYHILSWSGRGVPLTQHLACTIFQWHLPA